MSKKTQSSEDEQVKMLADLIKANPDCVVVIDNDNWQVGHPLPPESKDWNDGQEDEWHENKSVIASNRQFPALGISYGYGVLQALAYILGIKVERV